MIDVRGLEKHYKVHKREPGLASAIRSLVRRRYEVVRAVDGLSFRVDEGERVGFLGPNGAGKTTTLKILSGLLHPTSARSTVAGHLPRQREPSFLKQITLVMGQKQQLLWDLPPVGDLPAQPRRLRRPAAAVRGDAARARSTCSRSATSSASRRASSRSGERMKCELAAALLHRPKVLFLDEPTIGLDVSMQATVRQFVKAYNERFGATVLLTSHYMEDVVQLCPRVIVIDRGRLLYDGDLTALSHRVRPDKRIRVRVANGGGDDLGRFGAVVSRDDGAVTFQVPADEVSAAVARILGELTVTDLTVEDPPLEEVMSELFRSARAGG